MSASPALGTLVEIDGWILDLNWFAPGEGPFTVIAKLALANVVDAQQICRRFGQRLTPWHAAAMHARTLLDPWWLRGNTSAPQLAGELSSRSLKAISERWCHNIACDRALRYCPSCLALGYQSVLCQVDGLKVCPIHGDTLLARCQACGAPTPPYAITREGFDRPMVCHGCDTAYAPIWTTAPHNGAWQRIEDEAGYQQFQRWLERTENLDVQWSGQARWLSGPTGSSVATKEKRRCTASVLATLLPAPALLHDDHVRSIRFLSLSSAPQRESQLVDLTTGRTRIFKSIRRHYARRFGVRATAKLRYEVFQGMWCGEDTTIMPRHSVADPRPYGLWLWRFRFEESLRMTNRLQLYSDLLNWPLYWCESDQAWGHFAHECLLLDLEAAIALNLAIAGLDYRRDEDRAAWIGITRDWYSRKYACFRLWPHALTTLRWSMPSQPTRTYLVTVGRAHG